MRALPSNHTSTLLARQGSHSLWCKTAGEHFVQRPCGERGDAGSFVECADLLHASLPSQWATLPMALSPLFTGDQRGSGLDSLTTAFSGDHSGPCRGLFDFSGNRRDPGLVSADEGLAVDQGVTRALTFGRGSAFICVAALAAAGASAGIFSLSVRLRCNLAARSASIVARAVGPDPAGGSWPER